MAEAAAATPAVASPTPINSTPKPATGAVPPAAPPAENPAPVADSGAAKEGEAAAPPAETKEQRMARLSRAAKAARRAAAQNRELLAQQQQMQQRMNAVQQQAQSTDAQIARLRQLAQSDPMAFAKELGLNPKQLIEAGIKESSPEAQLEARIRAAEERAKAAEERAAQWETRQQQELQAQQVKAAQEQFLTVSGDAKAYPNVSRMPPQARIAWAQQLLAEDRARAAQMLSREELSNYRPTNQQLLVYMEKLAAAGSEPPTKATPDPSPAATPNSSASPQTVTNALASAKYTLPADFEKLSDAEQKKHLARYLESLGGGKKKRSA